MKPVKHAGCNVVYRGPTPDIGDLHCTRQSPGHIEVVYELDGTDREAIARGGRIRLTLLTEPIPPISMTVIPEETCRPIGEHGWKGQAAVHPGGLSPAVDPDTGVAWPGPTE